jgi:prepilin-type N-terminal cleavage/methylation domain-containing protein
MNRPQEETAFQWSQQSLTTKNHSKQNKMNYLKTMNKQVRQRGTTLIELSVVIAVLLLLVGVLFIGITAWKDGANKSACILNISASQKALRGYQNMNPGAATPAITDLVSAGFFGAAPVCPAAGTYTYSSTAVGSAFAVCSLATSKGHAPVSTVNW